MSENEKITLRANLLGGMNDYILEVIDNDEITDIWVGYCVANGAEEEDLIMIAENDAVWNYVCKVFGKLVNGDLEGCEWSARRD